MNVFVLCTGRCGSLTFAKACSHIDNFSSAHESRSSHIGASRFDYPKNHIEVDNRLSWVLGRLDETYGDDAFYVHLKRVEKKVATSFTRRYKSGIIRAYRGSGIIMGLPEETDPMSVSVDYCRTVNTNISLFLKDKSKQMLFNIESYKKDFPVFWERINAMGNFDAAISEFKIHHNAST